MPVTTAARVIIHAPRAAAWEVVADYANDPLWRGGVSRMDQTPPGEVREGAPVVEELRVLGRLVRTELEVWEVRTGEMFSWRATDGTNAHGTRTITTVDETTCELHTWRRIHLTGADRLLQPLVAWIFSRNERKDLRRVAHLIAERWNS